jgi:hypothetical protein
MSSSNCAQSFAEKIVEIVQNAEIPVRAHVQDRRKKRAIARPYEKSFKIFVSPFS